MIEITETNKIVQEIEINLKGRYKEKFFELIKGFVESNTVNDVEGNITNVYLTGRFNGDIKMSIVTLKEDKLKSIDYDKK